MKKRQVVTLKFKCTSLVLCGLLLLSKQFESCSRCFLEYQVSRSVTGSVEWQLRGILEAYSTHRHVKISSLHLILVTAVLIIQRN